MENSGLLYLLPNLIHEEEAVSELPAILNEIVPTLDGLIAESEKEGRRFLKHFVSKEKLHSFKIKELSEHTKEGEYEELLKPLLQKERWGFVSDAGLPCLADPGSHLVYLARKAGIYVDAISGPSSLILALLLSGLTAQKFSFHGYLPKSGEELRKALLHMERSSKEEKATQLWIETPYRSEKLFSAILEVLHPDTLLCLALDLKGPLEFIKTQKIANWKKQAAPVLKLRAIFLILSC